MALLSTQDLSQIRSDIRDIVHDTSINTTVKYRQYVGEDFYNPQDQMYGNPYTDWSGVSAIKGLVTQKEFDKVGGGIEIGDTKFVIMQSDVSGTLSVSDRVVESGATYEIRKLNVDPLDLVYLIYAFNP